MDTLRDLLEDAQMREIEVERDINSLAWHLAAPLMGLSARFALTVVDRNACAEVLKDAAKAALARQLQEARDEIDTLDAMAHPSLNSARSPAAGSVSH